jgi:sulfatase maturation enzyme AslB (radical SAM superfamily)
MKNKKNICILPWIAVDRNRNTGGEISLGPCCLWQSKETYKDVKTYWNNNELVQLRKDFINDERPSSCRLCWKNEDAGIKSLRQSVNEGRLERYKDRLTQTVLSYAPAQIKFTVGKECNLACRMCLPQWSSKVQKVWEVLGKKQQTEDDQISVDPSYILENRKDIEYIDIMGGEPFYHKKAKNLLKELIKTKDNEHITVYITTNATRIDLDTIYLLKQFQDVVLSISIDGIGKVQEYIRPGCDWDKMVKNIKLLKHHGISLQVVATIGVLNILGLQDLENWCHENQIHWGQPTLIEKPVELQPHNLPYQLHEFVPEKYKKYIDEKPTHDPVNFVRDLDRYWQTDIVKPIPEWKNVFDNLHWHNINYLKKINQEAEKYVG